MEDKELELMQKAITQIKESNQLIEQLTERVKKQDEQLKTWEKIKQPESQVDIKNAADILKLPYFKGKTLGQNLLFEFLRYCEILSSNESNWNEPFHKYIPKYFNTTEVRKEYIEKTFIKTIVTQEGLDFIRQLFEEEGDKWISNR